MPPQTTFIKVDNSVVIAIKVFVNRASTDHQLVNINEKSPVTLREYSHARLSNNQLNVLVNETLRDDLAAVLLEKPIREIVVAKESAYTMKMPKHTVFIPYEVIIGVRQQCDRLSWTDSDYLAKQNVAVPTGVPQPRLITRSVTVKVPVEEEEESGLEAVDEKRVDYRLGRNYVVGYDESITVYVNP
ncbi:hypothetical protein DICA4_F15852 [Diutina catenulata]